MSQIEFYYLPESPPCRAVEMVAAALGVDLKKHLVDLRSGEHLKEPHSSINPMGKVPFLKDGDLGINESRAICAYLVNKYAKPDNTLYPVDPVKRAQVDEVLFLDIGAIWEGASSLYRPVAFGSAKELDPECIKKFQRTLDYLEKRIKSAGDKKFLTGDHLTIGDISVVASFSIVEACGLDMTPYKSINDYLARAKSSIPKYHEINDKACENLKNFFDSKRKS